MFLRGSLSGGFIVVIKLVKECMLKAMSNVYFQQCTLV